MKGVIIKKSMFCFVFLFLLTPNIFSQKLYELNTKKDIDISNAYLKAEACYQALVKNMKMPSIDLDLDALKSDSLYLKLIVDPYQNNADNKYFISSVMGMLAHRDSVFILDYKQSQIYISNYDGKVLKAIGRYGSGPGEFKNPSYITENNLYYFIYDHSNGRIQILNKHFKYLKSFPINVNPTSRGIAADENHLFANTDVAVPFTINSYDINSLSLLKDRFIDKAFAFNDNLLRHNQLYQMRIAVSTGKYIVAACSLTPYIFIFDKNGKPLYSIKYHSKKIKEDIRNPLSGFYVRFINEIAVKGDNLFVLMPGRLLIYDLKARESKKYFAVRKKIVTDCFAIFGGNLFVASLSGEVYKSKINY